MENFTQFNDCISEINNTQIDNANDIDVVMPTYKLIEYSFNYSKTSRSLWEYYRDQPDLNNPGNITDFPDDDDDDDDDDDSNTVSFKSKQKIKGQTNASDAEDVEVTFPLKYLSNFGRTLEVQLINC